MRDGTLAMAIITVLIPAIVLLLSAITAYVRALTTRVIRVQSHVEGTAAALEQVRISINSRLEEMLVLTRGLSRAEGVVAGRLEAVTGVVLPAPLVPPSVLPHAEPPVQGDAT